MLAYEEAVLDLGPVIYLPMNEQNLALDGIRNLAVSELGKPNFPVPPVANNITQSTTTPYLLVPEVGTNGSWSFNGTSSYVQLLDGSVNGSGASLPGWNTSPGTSSTVLSQWTIGVWINQASVGVSPPQGWHHIYRVSDFGHGLANFMFTAGSGSLRHFTYNASGTFYGLDRSMGVMNNPATTEPWRFVWARFDGSRIQIGRDHFAVSQHASLISSTARMNGDTTPFSAIGRNGQFSTEYFKGNMSHFFVLPYAVDNSKMGELYEIATGTFLGEPVTLDLPEVRRELQPRSTGGRINVVPIKEDKVTLPHENDGLTLLNETKYNSRFEYDADTWWYPYDIFHMKDDKWVLMMQDSDELWYSVIHVDPINNSVTLLKDMTFLIDLGIGFMYGSLIERLSDTKILWIYRIEPQIKEQIIEFDTNTNSLIVNTAMTLFPSIVAGQLSLYYQPLLRLDDETLVLPVESNNGYRMISYNFDTNTEILTAGENLLLTDAALNISSQYGTQTLLKIDDNRFVLSSLRNRSTTTIPSTTVYFNTFAIIVRDPTTGDLSVDSIDLKDTELPVDYWLGTQNPANKSIQGTHSYPPTGMVRYRTQMTRPVNQPDYPSEAEILAKYNEELNRLDFYAPHAPAASVATPFMFEDYENWDVGYYSWNSNVIGDSFYLYLNFYPYYTATGSETIHVYIQRAVFEDGFINYKPIRLLSDDIMNLDTDPVTVHQLSDDKILVLSIRRVASMPPLKALTTDDRIVTLSGDEIITAGIPEVDWNYFRADSYATVYQIES